MKIKATKYKNATVYRFKTDLLTDGELTGAKALNIVSVFNDGQSIAIYQRFWTDDPNKNERVLRNSGKHSYIERAICIKPETLQIIMDLVL